MVWGREPFKNPPASAPSHIRGLCPCPVLPPPTHQSRPIYGSSLSHRRGLPVPPHLQDFSRSMSEPCPNPPINEKDLFPSSHIHFCMEAYQPPTEICKNLSISFSKTDKIDSEIPLMGVGLAFTAKWVDLTLWSKIANVITLVTLPIGLLIIASTDYFKEE